MEARKELLVFTGAYLKSSSPW